MSGDHPVVIVELFEDEPLTRAEFEVEARKALNVDAQEELDQPALDTAYKIHLAHFQPFRWHSQNDGNHEVLGHGERYFKEEAALANIRQQYADQSHVFLRRPGQGDERLRMPYPNDLGEVIVLGPDIQATADGSVITWKGVNYIPQTPPAEPDRTGLVAEGPYWHKPDCRWMQVRPEQCAYRATHYYCPHPEHACDCGGKA